MIRRLIVLKGHPTFEMIVERLVSLILYVPRFPVFNIFLLLDIMDDGVDYVANVVAHAPFRNYATDVDCCWC